MALHAGSFTSSFSRSLSCRRNSGRVFPTRARRRWGRFQRPRPPTLRFDNVPPRDQVDTDPFLRCPCFSTRRLTSRPFPESRRCRRMRRRRGSSATPTTLLGAAEASPHPGVTAKISSPMLNLHVSTSGDVGPGSLGSSSSSLLEDSPRLLPSAYTPSPPRLPRLRPVSRFVVWCLFHKSQSCHQSWVYK